MRAEGGPRRGELEKRSFLGLSGERPGIHDFGVIAMTVDALGRGILVHDNRLLSDEPGLRMALLAQDLGVASGQGEVRAGVMIECGRNPALGRMAVDAMCLTVFGDELGIVSVPVTGFALLRCAFESRTGIRGGFVALAAGHRAVHSQQGKFGFCVIKAVDLHPGLRRVAGFAAEGCSIGTLSCHAIIELPLVRILVTGGAGAVFEMERQDSVRTARGACLVTIAAGNRHVCTRQGETRRLVLCDGERRAMKIGDGVTGLATIAVGCPGELSIVRVFVTIGAG